jgi:hypothetical protein
MMEDEAVMIEPQISVPEDIQEELRRARQDRRAFSNPADRASHLRLFFAWLPRILQDAPGIQWDKLPSQAMGHLVRTVADHPDAIPIALAVGSSMHGMKRNTLLHVSSMLLTLCRHLRAHFGMTQIVQLQDREIWMRFVTGRQLTAGEVRLLTNYASVTAGHLRTYLEHLNERQRVVLAPYVFPPLPARFLELHAQHKASVLAAQARRKEQSDVLTPLLPLLIEIAQLRKQAMERLYKAFCAVRDQAQAGQISLPYHFQYTDRWMALTEDASTIAEVVLVERPLTLTLTLWTRESWVEAHPELYGRCVQWQRRRQLFAYAAEKELYFLQYEGNQQDLLWCGDILANWSVLADPDSQPDEAEYGKSRRWHTALGLNRPGLLAPPKRSSVWFRHATSAGALLFEPESLYRGTLYAAALATLTLTNGSRVSELLQVSATRFETIVVDETKQQQSTGRKIGLLVQKLLPKGCTQENERQLFLVGEIAGRLLREIGQLLQSIHNGVIPVVHPTRSTKSEDLMPEPYLFQWAASPDGHLGLLSNEDVSRLLRFLFHGLTFTTRTGRPIRIVAHLLRHVLATHVRTVQNVPAEAVAYLLHHRVQLTGSTHALTIPEATAYYSRLPTAQLLAMLFEAQSSLTPSLERSYVQAPSPQTLEQMDERLRQIFEQWSLIGPTVLGFCSAGLCVRPTNRALCLGCRFLVPHYSNLPHAHTWRKLYVLHAEQYEAHGHTMDAKQARQMIQYLDDLIAVMHIQIRARQDGGYLPFADTLFPDARESEKKNDRDTHSS